LDLSTLEDTPGVDTDRRILRLFLFAEWAFAAAPKRIGKPGDSTGNKELQQTLHSGPKAKSDEKIYSSCKPVGRFQDGAKVVIVNHPEEKAMVSGMAGRVIGCVDEGRYLVSFPNLEDPQVLDGIFLRHQEKVKHEQHVCVCGKEADLMCKRCQVRWYCSKHCQVDDYPEHQEMCKRLGPGNTLTDRIVRGVSQLQYDGANEEQDEGV